MPDPNPAKKTSRPTPPLAEVRRLLDRYRRRSTEPAHPRGARRRTDGPPTLRDRRT